jgi:hypothetical protein
MSFPDGFKLPPNRNDADRLVGNALPPTMMKNLVSQFFDANEGLFKDLRISSDAIPTFHQSPSSCSHIQVDQIAEARAIIL